MFPFSHSVTPAVRSHLEAQVSFFNEMTKSMSQSFQSLCQLNLQLGQTMLEEGNIAGQQLLTSGNATDALTISAARAQPTADKLRAYQQHISRVMADAQVELARVTEQHSPLTSRTARDLADQVAHVASEETEKSHTKQQETMKNFRDPFQHNGSAGAHGNLQSAGQGSEQGGQFDPQAAGKGSAKAG
jgi:phasin family protein